MTSNVRNQGIAHLSFSAGGQPFCKSRRAHIVCAAADAGNWGAICKRCAGRLEKMKADKAKKEAKASDAEGVRAEAA